MAWIHRLIFLQSNRDRSWPFTLFYEGDSRTFFEHARALLDGRLYDSGIPFHPPGFPTFLAGLHAMLGAGDGVTEIPHFTIKVVLALFSSLSVGFLFLLIRPYLGRRVALGAALSCVYHFGLYVIAIAPVSEGLYLTLLLASLVLWSQRLEHPLSVSELPAKGEPPSWWIGFGLGLLLGALALLRAESVLISALLVGTGLCGVLLSRRRRRRRRRSGTETSVLPLSSALQPWLLIGLGFVLALAPWTVRNAIRLAEFNELNAEKMAEPLPTFVPVTLYGPINLALANRSGADGTFSPDPVNLGNTSGALDLTHPKHLRFVLHGDEMAWQWIRSHPTDWASLVLAKWRLSADVFKLGWTQWNWPGGLEGVRRPVDIFVPDQSPFSGVLPILALVGWIACLATPGGPRRWGILSGLLIAAGLLTIGLFFGYARQALLLLPFVFSLIAAGPILLWKRAGRFSDERPLPDVWLSKRFGMGLLSVAVLLLLMEGAGTGSDRNFEATGPTGADGHHLNADSAIRLKVLE